MRRSNAPGLSPAWQSVQYEAAEAVAASNDFLAAVPDAVSYARTNSDVPDGTDRPRYSWIRTPGSLYVPMDGAVADSVVDLADACAQVESPRRSSYGTYLQGAVERGADTVGVAVARSRWFGPGSRAVRLVVAQQEGGSQGNTVPEQSGTFFPDRIEVDFWRTRWRPAHATYVVQHRARALVLHEEWFGRLPEAAQQSAVDIVQFVGCAIRALPEPTVMAVRGPHNSWD